MKHLALFLALTVSAFAQVPTAEPEPTATTYDVSQLNLLPTYTQSSYQAATGTAAPPFDLTKPQKNWYDSTQGTPQTCASGGTVTYQSLVQFAEVPFMLSACDAAAVNLPPDVQPTMPAPLVVAGDGVRYSGLVDLDAWLQGTVSQAEIAASSAPLLQSTPITAATLVAQLAPAAQAICSLMTADNQFFKGGVDPACATPAPAIAKYTASITAWATAAAAVQSEIGDVTGTACTFCAAIARAPVPMPVRPLYPDEQVQIGGIMGGVIVMRVPVAAAPVVVAAPHNSAAILVIVTDIQARLKQLMGQ